MKKNLILILVLLLLATPILVEAGILSEIKAFFGIAASDAIHLDENYNKISNIYEDIKAKDNNWSENIYEDEFVKVTFEQALS